MLPLATDIIMLPLQLKLSCYLYNEIIRLPLKQNYATFATDIIMLPLQSKLPCHLSNQTIRLPFCLMV